MNTYKYPKSGYNSSYATWSQLSNVVPVIQHGASHTTWSQLYNVEAVIQRGASFENLHGLFMIQLSIMDPLIQHGANYTAWGQLYNVGPVIQGGILGLSKSKAGLISACGTCGIYKWVISRL